MSYFKANCGFWKKRECYSLSHIWLFAKRRTIASQTPPSMGFSSKNTGVGCHSVLQGIFLTQGSNPGLLHCRQILYHLSHQALKASQTSSSQQTPASHKVYPISAILCWKMSLLSTRSLSLILWKLSTETHSLNSAIYNWGPKTPTQWETRGWHVHWARASLTMVPTLPIRFCPSQLMGCLGNSGPVTPAEESGGQSHMPPRLESSSQDAPSGRGAHLGLTSWVLLLEVILYL